MPYNPEKCNTFWGSHGCDLPVDHDGQHICTTCCAGYSEPDHAERHAQAPATSYGLQPDGCAGTWPYYGRKNMAGDDATLPFFRPDDGHGFVNLPREFDRLAAMRVRRPRRWWDRWRR